MVFGTGQDVSCLRNTAAENATSEYMMGAWAAFARDTKMGLTEYGWPTYNETGTLLFR